MTQACPFRSSSVQLFSPLLSIFDPCNPWRETHVRMASLSTNAHTSEKERKIKNVLIISIFFYRNEEIAWIFSNCWDNKDWYPGEYNATENTIVIIISCILDIFLFSIYFNENTQIYLTKKYTGKTPYISMMY